MIFSKIIASEMQLFNIIHEGLASNKELLITYFNQNCFNIFQKNIIYNKLLEEKFLVFADGTGVFWTYKLFNRKSKIKRSNATDIYNKLFETFATKGVKIYIIGGNFSKELVCSSLKDHLDVVGYFNGFFSPDKLDALIDEIKILEPDVVAVGMGVPTQELLADEISNKIQRNTIYICVGNFFEFYFNTQKRAPLILRSIGMEWFFRLIIEPRKLWKRYLLGIPLYFINILRSVIKK